MVHVTELGGDYYQFDEARQELRGERTGIRYRIGDRLHVLVSRVDLDARKIEFSLVKANGSNERDGMRLKPSILANDSGRPSKKAAHKKTRPAEKAPKRETTTASKKSKAKTGKTARQPSMGQGAGRKSHKGKRK
jgi:ribonuclease R